MGAAFGASLVPGRLMASPFASNTTPKRIIFFMQNQGFDPMTCIPDAFNSGIGLIKLKANEHREYKFSIELA